MDYGLHGWICYRLDRRWFCMLHRKHLGSTKTWRTNSIGNLFGRMQTNQMHIHNWLLLSGGLGTIFCGCIYALTGVWRNEPKSRLRASLFWFAGLFALCGTSQTLRGIWGTAFIGGFSTALTLGGGACCVVGFWIQRKASAKA